jgi:hypothetical protein
LYELLCDLLSPYTPKDRLETLVAETSFLEGSRLLKARALAPLIAASACCRLGRRKEAGTAYERFLRNLPVNPGFHDMPYVRLLDLETKTTLREPGPREIDAAIGEAWALYESRRRHLKELAASLSDRRNYARLLYPIGRLVIALKRRAAEINGWPQDRTSHFLSHADNLINLPLSPFEPVPGESAIQSLVRETSENRRLDRTLILARVPLGDKTEDVGIRHGRISIVSSDPAPSLYPVLFATVNRVVVTAEKNQLPGLERIRSAFSRCQPGAPFYLSTGLKRFYRKMDILEKPPEPRALVVYARYGKKERNFGCIRKVCSEFRGSGFRTTSQSPAGKAGLICLIKQFPCLAILAHGHMDESGEGQYLDFGSFRFSLGDLYAAPGDLFKDKTVMLGCCSAGRPVDDGVRPGLRSPGLFSMGAVIAALGARMVYAPLHDEKQRNLPTVARNFTKYANLRPAKPIDGWLVFV